MRDPKILAVALSERGQHPCRPDIELIEASLTIRGLVRALEKAQEYIQMRTQIDGVGVYAPSEVELLHEIDEALSPNGKETPAHEYTCFASTPVEDPDPDSVCGRGSRLGGTHDGQAAGGSIGARVQCATSDGKPRPE